MSQSSNSASIGSFLECIQGLSLRVANLEADDNELEVLRGNIEALRGAFDGIAARLGIATKEEEEEEEEKQLAFKSILNRLTPRNVEELQEFVLEERISTAPTLIGLVAQLFEKAVSSEPTLAEPCAMMCRLRIGRIRSDGIEFIDPDRDPSDCDPKKITFMCVLLDKCQEEFEKGKKGDSTIKAAEQEKLDASESNLARRRMLGNVIFIGELFKKHERIMHTCIIKLLGGRGGAV
jgi:hypothetical protein